METDAPMGHPYLFRAIELFNCKQIALTSIAHLFECILNKNFRPVHVWMAVRASAIRGQKGLIMSHRLIGCAASNLAYLFFYFILETSFPSSRMIYPTLGSEKMINFIDIDSLLLSSSY